MQFITIKRFKRNGIGGQFNIPYGTPLEMHTDGVIYYKGSPVCAAKSAASHEHFARNDDGNGQERGRLSHAVIDALNSSQQHNETWQVIWNDPLTQKYRRTDHLDTWLWNDDFFIAPIEDLKYIAVLVGIKVLH